jgi:carboxypeptidase T
MRYLSCLIFVAIAFGSFAQNARLKVWTDPITKSLLDQIGVEKDHGVHKNGVFFISDFTANERTEMKAAGIDFEVLIDDVTDFYAKRNTFVDVDRSSRTNCFENQGDSVQTPDGFGLGSMGGFYTYEEFLAHLDTMASRFPNLITIRQPIDTFLSHEQRPIYWVKISDNPQTNEAEPEVLYTAIHHAREPESLTQLIFYMYYLLENYGTNDEVTHLVDNTEMFFVPMINPDGYVHNQTTDPNGGGLWRKNRKQNSNGTMGVDLNRNYGFKWGYDNTGSSNSPASETYRGAAPFSEPETQAVKWFCEQNEFDLALNYHAFGNYLIYPWGYIASPLSPDSNLFFAYGAELTAQNNYSAGTGFQTVGYTTNGDSDDWMYGEQIEKPKVLAMTPEVGGSGDGFWPAISRIEPIAQENVKPNLLLSHFAGNYLVASENGPVALPSLSGQLTIEATRLGLRFDQQHEVKLIPVSGNITSTTQSNVLNTIDLGETQQLQLAYQLDPNTAIGSEVLFDLECVMGSYSYKTRISKIYGSDLQPIASPSDIGEFNVTGSWNTTTEDFTTAPVSFTDSPNDNYANSNFGEIEYKRILDLRNATQAYLSFDAQWEIESGWDYAQVLISEASENNYVPACALYSKQGSEYQDEGQPVWDGVQLNWIKEQVDLSDYLGQRVKVKFIMLSDAFVNFDGFYFDDLELNLLLDPTYTGAVDTGYWDTLGTVGFDESAIQEKGWSIFPNPTTGLLNVKSQTRQQADVIVRNMMGAIVFSQTIQTSGALNLSMLSSGMYVVEIKSEDRIEVHEFVKQ